MKSNFATPATCIHSLKLAATLTWLKERIEQYGFVEGEDFSPISGKSTGGRPTIEYHLTLDMAKELAMVENNEQGRIVRRYFIQSEKELRHSKQEQQNRMIEELRDAARHVHTLPGVTNGIWDGMTMRQVETLQRQSRDTMTELLAATHPAQQLNMHYQLRQINDALGIPTAMLDEINGTSPSV